MRAEGRRFGFQRAGKRLAALTALTPARQPGDTTLSAHQNGHFSSS